MAEPCPKCIGGKLFPASDHRGRWDECYACGFVVELDRRGVPLRGAVEGPGPAKRKPRSALVREPRHYGPRRR